MHDIRAGDMQGLLSCLFLDLDGQGRGLGLF